MNHLKTLKRLNITFAILLTVFNTVTTVSVGMRLGEHGWSFTEKIIIENQIVEQEQTMAPMIAMLIFLWAFQALLLMNLQFLKSLEKPVENHENNQKS